MRDSCFDRVGCGIEAKGAYSIELKKTQLGRALRDALEQVPCPEHDLTGDLCPMAATLRRGFTI